MPVILQADANPGTASWVDQSTIAGALTSIQKRVQLADVQVAATTASINFDDAIPAGSVVLGVQIYVTTNLGGGGATSGSASLVTPAPQSFTLALSSDILLAPTGRLIPLINGPGTLSDGLVAIYTADSTPVISITSDVNLDTLTGLDVTGYVLYAPVTGFSIPA